MGNNSSPSLKRASTGVKIRLIETTLAFLFGYLVLFPAAGTTLGGTGVHKTAHQYIADFRAGVNFGSNDSVAALIQGRRIDKSTLSILTRELASGTPQVRENIIQLLEKIGLEMDLPQPDKFRIIRDHSIIKALLIEGFAKQDAARSAAAGILRDNCKPSDLAAFHNLYIESLKQSKGEFLYLASKAKTLDARLLIDQMAELLGKKNPPTAHQVLEIAQAALGNTAIEDEFIDAVRDAEKNALPAPTNRFYNVGAAKDGTAVGIALKNLGLIGTRRSLLVACAYLRSPLKSYVKEVSERSIRDDALDSLLYNFPDERVLHRRRTVEDWAAAELFCVQNLGAVFQGPTPDIPRAEAYPRIR